jgi:hypothetical protein
LLRFQATIKIRGINPYVDVATWRAARLQKNWRRPMPVLVRLNGKPARQPWRINMMPTGKGGFYLYLHGSLRTATGTGVGDRVTVELGFDQAYKGGPMHAMPRWFSTALAGNAEAKLNWGKLTPSRRKEILRYFASLKSPESRERNLSRAMAALSGTSARFMARTWKHGR